MMKYLIVFAACFAATFAQTPSQKLQKTIEGLREQMPCGFPDKDIGPLAPLHGDYLNLLHKLLILKINGSLSDFTVNDLNTFNIDYTNLNVLTLKLNVELNINEFRAFGNHAIESFVIDIWKMKGKGTFDIFFRDFNVKVYARIGMVSSLLQMMELDIVLGLRNMKSKITGLTFTSIGGIFTSAIFDKIFTDYINDNAEDITDNLREILIPQINDYLKDFTVSDILKLLQEPSTPAEPCVPGFA